MVTRHRELAVLLLNEEIVQVLLLGELIAEANTVVIDTETYHHLTIALTGLQTGFACFGRHRLTPLLRQSRNILVIMVADGGRLTPYGTPGLIEGRGLLLDQLKAIHQVALLHAQRGMFVPSQFQAKV